MFANTKIIKYRRCIAVACLLLGGGSVAQAQQGWSASTHESPASGAMRGVRGALGGEARAEKVFFSLDEMPHVRTRSLDEMGADRLQPPDERMRDYLVRYQGLAAAEELRERDRVLRGQRLQGSAAQEAGAIGADDPSQPLLQGEFDDAGANE